MSPSHEVAFGRPELDNIRHKDEVELLRSLSKQTYPPTLKGVFIHVNVLLFIMARCSFIRNYKHVHESYMYTLQLLWG